MSSTRSPRRKRNGSPPARRCRLLKPTPIFAPSGSRVTDSFWDFHNKTEMECGAAEIILKAAEFDVSRLRRPKKDPPDCEGMLDGLWSAVELTRLTHQE